MDGRGRLAQSLKPPASGIETPGNDALRGLPAVVSRIERFARHRFNALIAWRKPRGIGIAASVALVVVSIAYGTVKGGHVPAIAEQMRSLRDEAANAVGFRIAGVALSGRKQLDQREVLRSAGITDHTSLLFLDVDSVRAGLKANPWIADAVVRKLYPDHLQIDITERQAFALWQSEGKISIIAADGTVLGPLTDRRFATLPLVVGYGAAPRARDFLALLDRYPLVRGETRAAILVAERRWNLKLKNDIDIRLPENDVPGALAELSKLAESKKLFSRDITAIDLRLADRVVVRLSEEAAKARDAAIKEREKKTKRKGGDA